MDLAIFEKSVSCVLSKFQNLVKLMLYNTEIILSLYICVTINHSFALDSFGSSYLVMTACL